MVKLNKRLFVALNTRQCRPPLEEYTITQTQRRSNLVLYKRQEKKKNTLCDCDTKTALQSSLLKEQLSKFKSCPERCHISPPIQFTLSLQWNQLIWNPFCHSNSTLYIQVNVSNFTMRFLMSHIKNANSLYLRESYKSKENEIIFWFVYLLFISLYSSQCGKARWFYRKSIFSMILIKKQTKKSDAVCCRRCYVEVAAGSVSPCTFLYATFV